MVKREEEERSDSAVALFLAISCSEPDFMSRL